MTSQWKKKDSLFFDFVYSGLDQKGLLNCCTFDLLLKMETGTNAKRLICNNRGQAAYTYDIPHFLTPRSAGAPMVALG